MTTIFNIIKGLLIFTIWLPLSVGWMLAPFIFGFGAFQNDSVIGVIIAAVIAVPFYSSGLSLLPLSFAGRK